MTEQELNQARAALANFLFPKDGEWEWYVSPKGYAVLKIKQRNRMPDDWLLQPKQAKEQAA